MITQLKKVALLHEISEYNAITDRQNNSAFELLQIG